MNTNRRTVLIFFSLLLVCALAGASEPASDTYHGWSLKNAAGDILYGSGSSPQTLYEVRGHRFAPSAHLVNPNLDHSSSAFAIHPGTGNIFTTNGRDLYEVDPASGQSRLVGETDPYLTSMAFAPNGTLYGLSTTRFYHVDHRTGGTTSINPIYGNPRLSFDPTTGQLWATTSGRIYRINRSTAESTQVASRVRDADGSITLYGSAIDSTGQMYAVGRQGGLYSLYLVEKETGEAAEVAPILGLHDLGRNRGLAFRWGSQNPSPGGGGASNCESNATTVCLNGGRFRVSARWNSSTGMVPARGASMTEDTGYFYYRNAKNVEFFAKILNGCAQNGSYWVFTGGMTDQLVEISIEDTRTGQRWNQSNPRGVPFLTKKDTAAFSSCP